MEINQAFVVHADPKTVFSALSDGDLMKATDSRISRVSRTEEGGFHIIVRPSSFFAPSEIRFHLQIKERTKPEAMEWHITEDEGRGEGHLTFTLSGEEGKTDVTCEGEVTIHARIPFLTSVGGEVVRKTLTDYFALLDERLSDSSTRS